MNEPKQSHSAPTGVGNNQGQSRAELTPDLVREVAEKVYALWLRDIKLEQERLGIGKKRRGVSPWR